MKYSIKKKRERRSEVNDNIFLSLQKLNVLHEGVHVLDSSWEWIWALLQQQDQISGKIRSYQKKDNLLSWYRGLQNRQSRARCCMVQGNSCCVIGIVMKLYLMSTVSSLRLRDGLLWTCSSFSLGLEDALPLLQEQYRTAGKLPSIAIDPQKAALMRVFYSEGYVVSVTAEQYSQTCASLPVSTLMGCLHSWSHPINY